MDRLSLAKASSDRSCYHFNFDVPLCRKKGKAAREMAANGKVY